jgi:hypothetical protein
MAAGPASRSHANRSAKRSSSGIARSRGCSGHGQAETSGLVPEGAKLTLRSRSRYCFASRLPGTAGRDPRLPWRSSPAGKALWGHAKGPVPATAPCSVIHLLINSPQGAALTGSRGRWPASRPAGDRGSKSAPAAGKVGPGGVGAAAARHPPCRPTRALIVDQTQRPPWAGLIRLVQQCHQDVVEADPFCRQGPVAMATRGASVANQDPATPMAAHLQRPSPAPFGVCDVHELPPQPRLRRVLQRR